MTISTSPSVILQWCVPIHSAWMAHTPGQSTSDYRTSFQLQSHHVAHTSHTDTDNNICLWPQKILKLSMKLTSFIPQDLCSHVFSPSSLENMLVPLAGSGPLMNDWTSSILSVSKSSVKSFLRSFDCSFRISFFPTWVINASNLFSRYIGGCRLPVFTSLVF